MGIIKIILSSAVVCVLVVDSLAARQRRAINSENVEGQKTEPQWKPVTGTREFSVNVDDQITGANQFRTEQWKNGTVIGSYASPHRDGKWLKVNYEADDKGFRIVKTQIVNADDLMEGPKTKDHTAHVDIKADGKPTEYTITEDQLNKAKNQTNEKQAQQDKPQ